MQNQIRNPVPAPAAGMNVQDMLLILFKHKWKIIVLTVVGLLAALYVYKIQIPIYESKAKVFVRYLVERSAVDSYDTQRGAGGRTGSEVIFAEMEILTSRDLAVDVAERVGVERLIPGAKDGGGLEAAANIVLSGLEIGPSAAGNVLLINFRNENPEIVQDVLAVVLDEYMEKHLQVHRPAEAFEFVSQRVDQVRLRLNETEQQLNVLREKAGVISLPERRSALDAAMVSAEQDVLTAKSEYSVQRAVVASLQNELNAAGQNGAPIAVPTPAVMREYRTLLQRLAMMQEEEVVLANKFVGSNPQLRGKRSQIRDLEGRASQLEGKFPGLVMVVNDGFKSSVTPLELERQKAILDVHKENLDRRSAHIESLAAEGRKLAEFGPQIIELERRREVDEESFKYFQNSLEKARVDEALDSSKIPNMDVLQKPTPPVATVDEKIKKVILALAGGGLLAGMGLAFLIELILNRAIRRPIELETQLQIPLLLSIPKLARLRGSAGLLEQREPNAEGGLFLTTDSDGTLSESAQPEHFILPYTDAIRDRLIFHFELHDMRHKPKLVALTGLSEGAGTSTLAAGVAMAFAKSDKAKVLLVDMNSGGNTPNPVYAGRELYTLPGALEVGRHDSDLRGSDEDENLFIAQVTPGRNADGNGVFAPRNLYDLMPDLRSSEFDYIIFDMPPVGLTSPTVSMAGLMDKVLLVLDSEKTDRDVLKRRYSELAQGKAHVSCIYNKVKRHAPRWVQGEV